MNWGTWIFIAFALFAVFIGTLVTVCMRQDVSLVTKEYYQEEINYQKQFERKQNTSRLAVVPEVSVTPDRFLEVHYPAFNTVTEGQVKLFRPADARLDQEFKLTTSFDTVQRFQLRATQGGLYKVKMVWTMEAKEYYLEKVIVL